MSTNVIRRSRGEQTFSVINIVLLVLLILITAYPSDDIIDKGMRKGVALTLPKPIDFTKLLDLVGFATH